jgi:UDP-N-acetylmuramoyl-tripeptide--D-alanyl-D-alanine ligase
MMRKSSGKSFKKRGKLKLVSLFLNDIAKKIKGTILQGSESLTFHKFNIDSRSTEPGELFFALTAKRNGHDFVPSAVKRGASGAVISQQTALADKDIALIQVNDTLKALQELARKVLQEYSVKVIGITGSIGKTTTKEFTSCLLSHNFKVLKSEGNLNNHLGVPLSILKLEDDHEVAVLEMAMSSPGEIQSLTRIAPPDIAVITNINPVHLQFFKNIEEIALAKKEMLDGAKKDGTAVLNGDDALVRKIAKDWKGKTLLFGLSEECDVCAQNIRKNEWDGIVFELIYGKKQEEVCLPFFYESALYNFLASAAVGYALSVPLDSLLKGVKALKPLPMRGVLHRLHKNIHLIDDSYNSNPAALESALKGLKELPAKRRIAVLGDMLELGVRETKFHTEAGKQVALWGWNILVAAGPLSFHMVEGALSAGMKKEQTFHFENSTAAAGKIRSLIQEGDLILVKGSRGMMMEKVVEQLKEE